MSALVGLLFAGILVVIGWRQGSQHKISKNQKE
jgi:hypothetical protein